MAQAARELQDEIDPHSTMQAAVRLATSNVRGCDAAGIAILRRSGSLETPAYTDEVVLAVDELQECLREGPCVQSAWEDRVVHSGDLAGDPRWPSWGPRVADELGVHSTLCFQLFTRADVLGTLSLYSTTRRAFDEQDRDEGLALAAHVAIAVAASQREQQLTAALDTRTTIGQACGIVMERYHLDAQRAFELLARISSETNIKLRELADTLIDTGHIPTVD